MVTTKNRAGVHLAIILAVMLLPLAGCKPPGARALLEGKRLLDKGQTAAAIEQLQKATALIGTNALAWDYLGLAYHLNGQTAEAAKAYQAALALNPNLVEVHYSLGCLLLEQNNPVAAKSELTAYTLSRPKDINGWLRLGTAQWRARDASGAEKSFNEVRRLDANNPEALNGLGMVQLSRSRAHDAETYFAGAVKSSPNYAPALLNLATVRQQYLGNRRGALATYRDYLDLKPAPANADAVAAVVQALELELNPPKPVVVAVAPKPVVAPPKPVEVPKPVKPEPVVEPVKTNPPVVVVVKTNPPVVAVKPPVVPPTNVVAARPSNTLVIPVITGITNAVPVPEPPPVIAIVSNVPVRVNPPVADAPPKAIAAAAKTFPRYAYRTIAKPKPGNRVLSEKSFALGLEAQKAKRYPDALAAFQAAAKADPSYFKAYYNVAWTAYALKDWPTALDAYETALAVEPESPDARYNFALTLKQANYPQDAANELERLLAKRPDDAAGQLLLANLYAQQLNSPRQARPHYARVLELQPQHPQATQIRYWLAENVP